MDEVKNYNIDITILSETKRKGCGNEEVDGCIHFWSGVEKHQRASAGVSIIIKNSLKKFIDNYEYVSERILTVTLKIYGYETIVVGVYAPTESTENLIKEQFNEQLSNILNKIKNHQDIIVAGDLNARVKSQINNQVVGEFAEEIENNNNGDRLIDLCNQYKLQLTNTKFAHKMIHRYTWERSTMGQKSIIDYIIVKQQANFQVHDSRVKRGANCGTDHHLVLAKFVYPFPRQTLTMQEQQKTSGTNKSTNKQYKVYLFYQESIKNLYQRRMTNEINSTPPSQNIEEEYGSIKKCIHKIAAETLGEYKREKKSNKQPAWLTEDIKTLIKEKKELHAKYLTNRNEDNNLNYKRKNKELRNRIKKGKNMFWEQKCNHINTYIGGAQSTEVWKTIKNMKTKNREKALTLIDLPKWKVYYEELLTENREEYKNDEVDIQNDNDDECRAIELEEFIESVSEMKNGRSAGPGDIPAELIKNGGKTLINRLRHLMNLCMTQKKTPDEWKVCLITSLFKKGNRKDPNSYRGLSVTSTMSRLWAKIIHKRLRMEVQGLIGEDQSGFRPGRSCVDNLFTLQQLIEKRISRDQELHLTFIDIKKAYDNVPRNKLWYVLKEIGVSTGIIELIQELYSSNVAYIKQGLELSEPIQTTKGLRQGCSLSPILFNIYLEMALRKWKRTCGRMGIPIGESYLLTLSFADDQVILAEDSYDMEFVLKRLYTEYEKWGLQVSLEKTEYLVVNTDTKFEVLINEETQVKQVNRFKYLGVTIDRDGIGQTEIQSKIQKARNIVGALNSVWWNNNISRKNKKRIGQTMVETVLMYGCEVWAIKEEDKKKITSVEMDYLRRSARRSRLEKIRNEQIRNEMAANESVIERIEKRSLKWFGHLLRMDDTRWPKRIFKWRPAGKNKKGRPRKSWNEGIRRAMRERNMDEEMAHNREAWKAGMGIQHLAV